MIGGHCCYQGSHQGKLFEGVITRKLLPFIIYAHILAYFLGDFNRKS